VALAGGGGDGGDGMVVNEYFQSLASDMAKEMVGPYTKLLFSST